MSNARNFLFVPGGFHGGWCFRRVADRLRDLGHRVWTPTLTGLGERSHLARYPVNLTTHIADVANILIWEDLSDVVLCGHSYGGLVISGVADQEPHRIAALAYLDAALAQNGQSTLDLMPADEREVLLGLVQTVDGQPMLPPFPASVYSVNAADAPMVDALCTPHPMASLAEPLRLTGAHRQVPRRCFVRATAWAGTHPETSYQAARADPAFTTYELACGHDIMLDAPDALVKILIELTASG